MTDYLNTVYNKKVKPFTNYPEKFVGHLYNKYKMKQGTTLLEPGVGI